MQTFNMDEPVEIEKDVYWVGSSEEALLRRNIYLRVFRAKDRDVAMVIDPGPECDFDVLKTKTASVLGSLSKVNLVFVNHQDPDVVPNARLIQKFNPNALTIMTEDTWRLVQFYGLKMENFRAVEKFRNMKAKLRTSSGEQLDYVLQFIPTPFCHFRGSCMYYDVNTRILFSGDFLGGISTSELYAEEAHWEGVKAFHQLYFPSRDALRHALEQIQGLDPQPLMIAPQHGGIIQGEMIERFIEHMEALLVGMDIIQGSGANLSLVIDTANEIVRMAAGEIGNDGMTDIFEVFHPDGSYPAIFVIGSDNAIRDIKGDPMEAIEALIQVIFSFASETQKNKLRSDILACLEDRGLPTFDLSSPPEELALDEVEFDDD
jgi:glyoxylase-like metal-dependent hydrolase (beta-lactamase superfamily II)